jgi:hypothetical protein
MYEYELESEFEWEGELEGEYEAEYEFEGEYEAEEFFGRLANLARTQWRTPGSPLRRIALGAARAAATRGSQALGGLIGDRLGQGALGRQLGTAVGGRLRNMIPEREWEYELEGEFEGEWEGEFEAAERLNPLRRVYPDALMEHLGHAATEAESEAEAEAFIGAMIPLAARLIPRVAPAVMRAAPQLIRGAAGVVRTLRRNPATRQLVRTVPTIVRSTVADIARQAGQGQAVTPQAAVRALARQTARTLSSPQRAVQAYRRSRALDQRHHRMVGPAAAATRGRAMAVGG